jgi:hypothetical protein
MGRTFLAIGKTILTVVIAAGMVIASFYFAYLLLILIVMIAVGTIAWFIYNREEVIDWLEYEDSD